ACTKADEQQKHVQLLFERIERASECNSAAEAATRVMATASLFETNDQIVKAYEVFASAAAGTAAILRACRVVKRVQALEALPSRSPSDRKSSVVEQRLLAQILEAAEKIACVFEPVAKRFVASLDHSPRNEKAGQALRDILAEAMDPIPESELPL